MRTAIALVIPLLLSSIYLLAVQLASPPTNLRPKIFVLGLSKTGTTSTGNALYRLGYRRLGWLDIRSRQLVDAYIHRDYSAIIPITQYYDAFEDLPWPGLYREMAELYPDAKFVLSLRKDEQTWLRSMRSHMSRGFWEPTEFWYGTHFVEGNETTVLERYRQHTAEVRDYFADKPERFVELVVDDGDKNWEVLCKVAQCPDGRVPSIEFPRSNSLASWKDTELTGAISRVKGRFVGGMEKALTHFYYKRSFPAANRALEALWHAITVFEMAFNNIYFTFHIRPDLPLS